MFAIVYCPDFFIQCERLFRPDLEDQALIITSDGRLEDSKIIASSLEAKKLGLSPGLSCAELADISNSKNKQFNIKVSSPNYDLYGDISNRFINSLELLAPNIQPCANDEVLLDLRGSKLQKLNFGERGFGHLSSENSFHTYAKKIRKELKQWTGISTVIGIAPTKTLAKVACDAAQRIDQHAGIVDLSARETRELVFQRTPVAQIKGISKKNAARLSAINIDNALELSLAPKSQIRRHSSVAVERIAIELSGLHCKEINLSSSELETVYKAKEPIEADSFTDVKQTLITQVNRASKYLKNRNSTCSMIGITLTRSLLDQRTPSIQNRLSVSLSSATNSERAMQKVAIQLFDSLWREDAQYHSIKLSLDKLASAGSNQFSFFSDTSSSSMDQTKGHSSKALAFETLFFSKNHTHCQSKRSLLPPSFTTKWADIPRVS